MSDRNYQIYTNCVMDTLEDIKQLIDKYKIIGAAAGSLFVFKGKYRAVLINYPTKEEKKILLHAKPKFAYIR